MQSKTKATRYGVAPLLASLLMALSACGGGGGGQASAASPSATALGASTAAPSATGASPSTDASTPTNTNAQPATTTTTTASPATDTQGANTASTPQPAITDTVSTSVSYQLPPNVRNLTVQEPSSATVLTGNALDNHIVGSPFVYEEIYGLDGDDVLDGGGRHGGMLDGGNGNDRLIVSFGELRGGPGADTFVAAGRGAHTSPDTPITIVDFNAAEGDRIEIVSTQAWSAADLFARGILRFDAATSTLTLDFDPATTGPGSVDQVIVLRGVRQFDPAWVSFTVR